MSTKVCSKCKTTKPLDQFYKLARSKDGYNPQCKNCKVLYTTNLYRTNINYRSGRIKQATVYRRKRAYGITSEEYERLLKSQNYCCAICNVHLDNTSFGVTGQLDHCHTTKIIRGILCSQCNTGIGNLKENEDILLSAIMYLRKFK